MCLEIDEYYETYLMLICLLKVYHDAGITTLERVWKRERLNDLDYYYDYALEALRYAAPIVKDEPSIYKKHGFEPDEGDAYIWAFSSQEMQEYYRLARKINRLHGGGRENPYEREIENKISALMGFYSYNFDYCIGRKRKGAQLETLMWPEFREEIPMCLWVVRAMNLFREELPKLKEQYRIEKRRKRVERNKKGGRLCAEM